jgi:hypothetical protein
MTARSNEPSLYFAGMPVSKPSLRARVIGLTAASDVRGRRSGAAGHRHEQDLGQEPSQACPDSPNDPGNRSDRHAHFVVQFLD